MGDIEEKAKRLVEIRWQLFFDDWAIHYLINTYPDLKWLDE